MSVALTRSDVAAIPQSFVPQAFGFFLASRIAITLLAFQSQPSAGSAAEIGGSLLFLYASWIVVPRAARAVPFPKPATWVCLYLALVLVSLLWSVTQAPVAAMAYWAALAADCVSVYLLVRAGNAAEICLRILRGFVIGASLVGLIAWTLPTLPDLRIGNEDFLHPNALGYTLALATLFALHLARYSRSMAFFAAFCAATLFRTISKASIAAFAAAAVYYLLRDAHFSRKLKITIGIVSTLVILASWGFVEAYFEIYNRSTNVETFTGRTYIWQVAWEDALKRPWFGHGFYSFRFVLPVLGDFEPKQAHNEFLQQFFSYGIVGVAFLVALYRSVIQQIWAYRRSAFATVAASVMVFAIVRGFVDTENFGVNYPLWLITLFAFALPSESQ